MAIGQTRTEAERTLDYARQMRSGEDEARRLGSALSRAASPTLFVGLGGTGCGVVARLKRRWQRLPEDQRSGRVEFCCIDTVHFNTHESTDPVVCDHIDPADEYVALYQPGNDLGEWFGELEQGRSAEEFARLLGWYDARQRPTGEQLGPAGAGAYRQFGRLAYYYAEARVAQVIEKCAKHITAASPGGALTTLWKPQVVVISGMSGGTGSGIFLDVVRLAHQAFSGYSPTVMAVLVMPDIYRDSGSLMPGVRMRMRPNCYAMLKELDWILAMDRTVEEYRRVGLELPCFDPATTPDLREFALPVFLLDKHSVKTGTQIIGINEMKNLAAEAVFAYTLGLNTSQQRSNLDEWMLEETPAHRRRAYAGLGVSRAVVPIYSVIQHLALRAFAEAAPTMLGLRNVSADSPAVEEHAHTVVDLIEKYATDQLAGRWAWQAPVFRTEDLVNKSPSQAAGDFRESVDSSVEVHLHELARTGERVLPLVAERAAAVLDESMANLRLDIRTARLVLETVRENLRKRAGSLQRTEDGQDSPPAPPGHQTDPDERLLRYDIGFLGRTLAAISPKNQQAREYAMATASAKKALRVAQDRLDRIAGSERAVVYAYLADTGASTKQHVRDFGPSHIDQRLAWLARAEDLIKTAAIRSNEQTARFSVRSEGDGEIGVTTWVFPAALRRTDGDEYSRAPEEYLDELSATLLDHVRKTKGGPGDFLSDALQRAEKDSPGFTFYSIGRPAPDGERADPIDALHIAFMKTIEDALQECPATKHLYEGIVSTAARDGIALAGICAELENAGSPSWRLSQDARKRADGGEMPRAIVWLGPESSEAEFAQLGLEGGWQGGSSNHELVRLVSVFGAGIEDLEDEPTYRMEYRKYIEANRDGRAVRTVHVAVNLDELIGDPTGSDADVARTEEAYERLALGLLLGKLFGAEHDPSACEFVDVSLLEGLRKLPAPIMQDKDGHYHLADYRIVSTRSGNRVALHSQDKVDLGTRTASAAAYLRDQAEHAGAIDLLVEGALAAPGPFAKTDTEAIGLLRQFHKWMIQRLERHQDASERRALEQVCLALEDAIEEREYELDTPFPETLHHDEGS